jgi:hypothetical protein
MAEDAVQCEPFSLLTGTNTGKIDESDQLFPLESQKTKRLRQFPLKTNREFIRAYQGIFTRILGHIT